MPPLYKQSSARGRPYHGLFSLSDDQRSGLVTLDGFRHTLRMLGCRLKDAEAAQVNV